MTRCGWLTSSPTCPWRCWAGCAATGCCTSRPRRASPAPTAGHPATAGSSPSLTRPPGRPARDHHHGDHPLRHRRRAGLGPAASTPDSPLRLARPRWPAASHRGHPDPPPLHHLPGDRHPQPRVAMVLRLRSSRPPRSTAYGSRFSAVSISAHVRLAASSGRPPRNSVAPAADRWTWLRRRLRPAVARPAARSRASRSLDRPAPPGRLTPARSAAVPERPRPLPRLAVTPSPRTWPNRHQNAPHPPRRGKIARLKTGCRGLGRIWIFLGRTRRVADCDVRGPW